MAFSPRINKLVTDSWDQDRHSSLKRWERFAQRTAWKSRGRENAALPLPCPWRDPSESSGEVVLAPAQVLGLFDGELILVRFVGPLEQTAGVRVLRGAIPWDLWCPALLRAYQQSAAVPEPFRPRRRLPPEWLDLALTWAPADQKQFFDRLRAAGLLAPPAKISAEGVSPWLRWEEVRGRFLDFSGKTEG